VDEVISIRVGKELKRDLEELNVDYADLVRKYLEQLVKKERRKRVLREVDELREGLAKRYKIRAPSSELVREDREL
jgi:Arc/MetJ-type ribon-helix-helix transcriptional regulator